MLHNHRVNVSKVTHSWWTQHSTQVHFVMLNWQDLYIATLSGDYVIVNELIKLIWTRAHLDI
jgi:hypothetical protein